MFLAALDKNTRDRQTRIMQITKILAPFLLAATMAMMQNLPMIVGQTDESGDTCYGEKCGPEQYCSHAEVYGKKCKNCTHFLTECGTPGEERIAEISGFRCGWICEVERYKEDLNHSRRSNEQLQRENENLQLTIYIEAAVFVLLMFLMVVWLRHMRHTIARLREKMANPAHLSTAHTNTRAKAGWFSRLCPWSLSPKLKYVTQPQPDDSVRQPMLPSSPGKMPTQPLPANHVVTQPDEDCQGQQPQGHIYVLPGCSGNRASYNSGGYDSGNNTASSDSGNSSHKSSQDSLQKTVAPTGHRTQFVFNDEKDFNMLNKNNETVV